MSSEQSVFLVSDERMSLHRPVAPSLPGDPLPPQLNPPCERPERIIRINERLSDLESSLVRVRRGDQNVQHDGGSTEPPKPQSSPSPSPFVRFGCRPVHRDTVTLCHPGGYYDKLRATSSLSDDDLRTLTAQNLEVEDVYFGRDTFLAASLACGGVVASVDAVLTGCASPQSEVVRGEEEGAGNESPRDVESFPVPSSDDAQPLLSGTKTISRAIAVVRPPGHHACQQHAMGFCFLNSVAVAAKHALTVHSARVERVLILDWDVHHGNGTQDLTIDDPNIMYVSLHRLAKKPAYFFPGTGRPDEVGIGDAAGTNLNVGWDCRGLGNVEYAGAFVELILPVISAFAPDLVLVSCGFDAASGDPLGGCELSPEMYYRMSRALMETVGVEVPTVVALEGGYNLAVISECMEAVALALLDEPWERNLGEVGGVVPVSTVLPAKRPDRNEVLSQSIDEEGRGVTAVDDMSMRSLTIQEASLESFNASTLMESVRHLIEDEGDTTDDDGGSSTSSENPNSSHHHLQAVGEGSFASTLPAPQAAILPRKPPAPSREERLRAGRIELGTFWNYESPSPRMKGMGAKKSAVRSINQSIRAIMRVPRWQDGSLLQLKEVPHQNEFGPVVLTRTRRTVEKMNQSLSDVNIG